MNKEKVLDGLTALLEFTDRLGAANKRASFAGNDNQNDMITPANERQILREAEESARAWAEARNRGSQPRSLAGLDAGLVQSVKDWCANKGKRLRGSQK